MRDEKDNKGGHDRGIGDVYNQAQRERDHQDDASRELYHAQAGEQADVKRENTTPRAVRRIVLDQSEQVLYQVPVDCPRLRIDQARRVPYSQFDKETHEFCGSCTHCGGSITAATDGEGKIGEDAVSQVTITTKNRCPLLANKVPGPRTVLVYSSKKAY